MTFLFRPLSIAAIALSLCIFAVDAQAEEVCTPERFETAGYTVCSVPPETDLRLFWKNANDTPYRRFAGVADTLQAEGKTLVFAMNAGMYGTDFAPMGLYVENGETLRPVDRKTLDGPQAKIPNFYKQPNGIFFFGPEGAGIWATEAFERKGPKVRFATQSGPLLVFGNRLNPIFIPGSSDRTRRSGVGLCASGVIRFAISDGAVNFHEFARLFRDHLACPDALFLDGGNGAGIYNRAMNQNDWSWHGGFGPIVGLVR